MNTNSKETENEQCERFFSCDCKGEGLLLTKDEEDKNIYFALY